MIVWKKINKLIKFIKIKRVQILAIITFFVIAIAGFFYSCKKDKNKITINGAVYDPDIKTYVSNAHVTISSIRISSGVYNSNYTDIATTITDGSGNFSFEFDKEKSAAYRFYIFKDNYFDNTIDIPDADIVPGTPYAPVFNIHPKAYLKLHVKNSAPWDSDDFIAYFYTSGYLSCYECCSNIMHKGYGQFYDTTSKCKTYGSQNVTINWHVTKMGIDIVYADTVFCTPFDTTFHEILY